jgi:hypothetical protein
MKSVSTGNPFVAIPYSGEHLSFESLDITFKVDEDLNNYMEIHDWLIALGKPENFDQYKAIEDNPSYSGKGIASDISLIILNSAKHPNYEIIFTDAFPTSVSELNFNTTDSDVNFISASASFSYTYYTVNKLKT